MLAMFATCTFWVHVANGAALGGSQWKPVRALAEHTPVPQHTSSTWFLWMVRPFYANWLPGAFPLPLLPRFVTFTEFCSTENSKIPLTTYCYFLPKLTNDSCRNRNEPWGICCYRSRKLVSHVVVCRRSNENRWLSWARWRPPSSTRLPETSMVLLEQWWKSAQLLGQKPLEELVDSKLSGDSAIIENIRKTVTKTQLHTGLL